MSLLSTDVSTTVLSAGDVEERESDIVLVEALRSSSWVCVSINPRRMAMGRVGEGKAFNPVVSLER